jgi:hypothetical protein
MRGTFELVHATQKTVLWSSDLNPGQVKCVHTVTSDEPILLLINLDFCRSSEGVLIHKPPEKDVADHGLTTAVMKGVKGFMEDTRDSQEDISIVLSDSAGQRLRLQLENKVGGGGHRKIVVYCPYWIVNTSQYALRLRDERSESLPAGTITSNRLVLFFTVS